MKLIKLEVRTSLEDHEDTIMELEAKPASHVSDNEDKIVEVEESNVFSKVEVNNFPVEVKDNSIGGSLDITIEPETVQVDVKRVTKPEGDPIDTVVECTEENDDREVETPFKMEKGSLCAAKKEED